MTLLMFVINYLLNSMFLTNVENTKLQKIADLFDKNTVHYSQDDLQESYDNLKNLFALLVEEEVERTNSDSQFVDGRSTNTKPNPYNTVIKYNTDRTLPQDITLTEKEIAELKQKLEDFYFAMKMLNSRRDSFIKNSSDEMKDEQRFIPEEELVNNTLSKVKRFNFVTLADLKQRQAEELKVKGNVDYVFTNMIEHQIQDEYGNWYYDGYTG